MLSLPNKTESNSKFLLAKWVDSLGIKEIVLLTWYSTSSDQGAGLKILGIEMIVSLT